jgi:predicted RNase H-like HicB family nuclease
MQYKIRYGVQVSFLREGSQFVAYCPALDLGTSGDTFEQARENFRDASRIFIEDLIADGTVEEVLSSLGWELKENEWCPPMIVSQETIEVPINQ